MAAARIPNQAPRTRKVQLRALVYAMDGPEKPYDVYRFSRGKVKLERPGHNPFKVT